MSSGFALIVILVLAGPVYEIAWRFSGDTVLGWCRGSHDPNELLARLDLLEQVVDNVPPYVWRDYAGVDPRV